MSLIQMVKFLLILHVTSGLRSYSMEFVTYEHVVSSEHYIIHSYKLIKIGDRTVLNGSAILRRDIQAITIRVIATATQSPNAKPFKWFDYTADVCELLDKSRKRPLNIMYYIQRALAGSGRLIADKCPYKKVEGLLQGEDYYMKNLYIDAENFPPHIPEMTLTLHFNLKERKVVFYDGNVTVAIQPKVSKKRIALKGK